jgi:hypothetical protein
VNSVESYDSFSDKFEGLTPILKRAFQLVQ